MKLNLPSPDRLPLILALASLSMAPDSAFSQEKLAPAPLESFSIVLIPDTQAYRGKGTKSQPESEDPDTNSIFEAHVQWISENLEEQKIAFVSHVGDMVDRNAPEQWTVARAHMDRIHGRVPYGISVGNHDMSSAGDSSLFQHYFPASRFKDFEWYGGTFAGSSDGPHISGNNANSFQLFSVGGLDLVFLHLECNAPDDVLEWANRILEVHPDRLALVTSHMGWGPLHKPKDSEEFVRAEKGRMTWGKIHGARGNTPQEMWEKCYRLHSNLFAVFAGDQRVSLPCRRFRRCSPLHFFDGPSIPAAD